MSVTMTMESWNGTIEEPENSTLFQFPYAFRVSLYILYNLVFVCGLLGNLLVYYTINFTHPRMKTIQNTFLANLALGDLLIVTLCVPVGYISVLWQYWPFGKVPCHLLSPAKAIGVFVSAYTLVALAVDRYMAIIHPLKPGLTRTQAKGVIAVIWIAAFVTAIPVAIYTKIDIHFGTDLPRCGEYGWKSLTQELTYSILLIILQYIFPVIVLIYTYTRILCIVWGKRIGNQVYPPPSKGKQKTVILSLSVVLGYTLAWLPYNIFYMINQHGPDWILETDAYPYLFLTSHFLAMSHTTFNPVIYAWINSKFRRAFVQVLISKCPCITKYFNIKPGSFNIAPSFRSSSTMKSFADRRRESGLLSPKLDSRNVNNR